MRTNPGKEGSAGSRLKPPEPTTENRGLKRYTNARADRLLAASPSAYESDLADFAIFLGARHQGPVWVSPATCRGEPAAVRRFEPDH